MKTVTQKEWMQVPTNRKRIYRDGEGHESKYMIYRENNSLCFGPVRVVKKINETASNKTI